MHAIELAILAARLVDRTVLLNHDVNWKAFELETYWSASRVRLDRWTQLLKQLPTAAQLLAATNERLASQFELTCDLSAATNPNELEERVEERVEERRASDSNPQQPASESRQPRRGHASSRRASRILRPHAAAPLPPAPHHSLADWKEGAANAQHAPADKSPIADTDLSDQIDTLGRLCEEILVSEIQCRVFTCLLQQVGGRETTQAAAAVVRSVWLGHQEMRCRVLAWLADGVGAGLPIADQINRTRRRCERWCDLLLARIGGDLAPNFAIDSARFAQFVEAEEGTLDVQLELEPLVRGSLEQLLGMAGEERAAFPDLNEQIFGAIAATVPRHDHGPSLHSLQQQVARLMSRMQVWIDACTET